MKKRTSGRKHNSQLLDLSKTWQRSTRRPSGVDQMVQSTKPDVALSQETASNRVAPAVTTDKADYAPGETALISASGFTPGATITFQIVDDPNDPGDDGDVDTYDPIVVADGDDGVLDGAVTTTWLVPTTDDGGNSGPADALNATLLLTATDSNGLRASTTFTDAGPAPVLTLDQSAGYQSTTNEIDLSDSTAASALTSLLESYGLSSFAGYTDAAVITPSLGGSFTSVSFALTDSTTIDTGLTDLNGNPINLSNATKVTSGSNDAWYFEGKVADGAPQDQVAFRLLYLPVLTSGQVTGYTLYTLLYNDTAPIRHSNPADPDDTVSMNSLVSAVTDLLLTYSNFTGIPSGQNKFVILKEPANGPDPTTSYDVVVTSKVEKPGAIINGTINTSSVAGQASAIGVGNQAVNWNEWVLYDFVTNATGNPKKINTLSYAEHKLLTSAFSTVTQLNPNNAKTRANVEVRLRDVNGDPQGDGLRNGASAIASNVDIKSVQVFRNGSLITPIINISAPDNPSNAKSVRVKPTGNTGITLIFYNEDRRDSTFERVVIEGLRAGDRFQVEGLQAFDRFIVGNAAPACSHCTFDLGVTGGSYLDAGSTPLGGFTLFDDGPTIDRNAATIPTLTTDDTDIPDSAGPTSFAGLFTTPDFGKDGFLDANDDNVEDANALTYALGVKSAGLNVDSGLVDTLTGDAVVLNKVGDAIVGTITGTSTEVFRITVNTDGEVSFTQSRSVVHNDPTDPAETGASAATLAAADLITLTATITDGDGDTDTAVADIGQAFKFEDDGPTEFTASDASLFNSPTSSATSIKLDTDSSFANNYGADGPGAVRFTGITDGEDSGLASGGSKIYYYLNDSGTVLTASTSADEAGSAASKVFTITLNATTATYDVQMYRAIDNGSGFTFSSTSGVNAGNPSYEIINNNALGQPEILVEAYDVGGSLSTVNANSSDLSAGSNNTTPGQSLFLMFGQFTPGNNGNPDNYTINSVQEVNGFAFNLSQVSNSNSGSPEAVNLRLTAYDTDGDKDTSVSDVDPPGGDAIDLITKIDIYNTAGVKVATFTSDGTQSFIDPNASIGSVTVTALFENNGSVLLTGLEGVPGAGSNGLDIQVWTSDGYDGLRIENEALAGSQKFSINNLSLSVFNAGSPVSDSYQVALYDGDGDFATDSFTVTWNPFVGPVAIDLNQDGVVTYQPTTDAAAWSTEASFSTFSAWVGSQDGLLVYDYNSDGLITEEREAVFTMWGNDPNVATDMQALAAYFDGDANGAKDGVLDVNDVAWSYFGVWQDLNVNGVQEEGEFAYLADWDITNIALSYNADSTTYAAADGDVLVYGQMAVTYTDGTTGLAEDVAFAVAPAEASIVDPAAGDPLPVAETTDQPVDTFIPDEVIPEEQMANANTAANANLVDQFEAENAVNDKCANSVNRQYENIVINEALDSSDPFLSDIDALAITESNDCDFIDKYNWPFETVEILSNLDDITGGAINLIRNVVAGATVDSSASSDAPADPITGLLGSGNTIGAETIINPLQIINAGFTSSETLPLFMDPNLKFAIGCVDGNTTATQSIDFACCMAAPPLPTPLPMASAEPNPLLV
jgi:hypothetical protein